MKGNDSRFDPDGSSDFEPVRRETRFHYLNWYRTLFKSYLYRPSEWVYVAELVVAALLIYLLVGRDDEGVSVLIHTLLGVGP